MIIIAKSFSKGLHNGVLDIFSKNIDIFDNRHLNFNEIKLYGGEETVTNEGISIPPKVPDNTPVTKDRTKTIELICNEIVSILKAFVSLIPSILQIVGTISLAQLQYQSAYGKIDPVEAVNKSESKTTSFNILTDAANSLNTIINNVLLTQPMKGSSKLSSKVANTMSQMTSVIVDTINIIQDVSDVTIKKVRKNITILIGLMHLQYTTLSNLLKLLEVNVTNNLVAETRKMLIKYKWFIQTLYNSSTDISNQYTWFTRSKKTKKQFVDEFCRNNKRSIQNIRTCDNITMDSTDADIIFNIIGSENEITGSAVPTEVQSTNNIITNIAAVTSLTTTILSLIKMVFNSLKPIIDSAGKKYTREEMKSLCKKIGYNIIWDNTDIDKIFEDYESKGLTHCAIELSVYMQNSKYGPLFIVYIIREILHKASPELNLSPLDNLLNRFSTAYTKLQIAAYDNLLFKN